MDKKSRKGVVKADGKKGLRGLFSDDNTSIPITHNITMYSIQNYGDSVRKISESTLPKYLTRHSKQNHCIFNPFSVFLSKQSLVIFSLFSLLFDY